MRRGQGWVVWGGALLLALTLPGTPWKPVPTPPFPWAACIPALGAVLTLMASALTAAALLGPRATSGGTLALLEAPPDLVWGGLALALWPAPWGPPGALGWGTALVISALPGEIRWLCATLPPESPFPEAWGPAVRRRARLWSLRGALPAWLGARAPLWITGALVLERIFGLQGLGSDWMGRAAARDRLGLALWVAALAALWALARSRRTEP